MADEASFDETSHTDLPTFRALIGALEERAAGQQALLLAHALLRNFQHGFVFVFDHDLRYITADGDGIARGGIDRHTLEGHTIWEVLPPEASAALEPIYRAALAGQTTTFEAPFADGIYEITVLPVPDERGAVVAGMVMARDITRRVRREQELRTSEARNRALINTIPDAIFLVSADGFFLDYKAEQDHLTEWPHSFKGRRVADALSPAMAERLMARVAEVLSTGEAQTFEYQAPVNGALLDLEGRIVPSDEVSVLFMTRDITERKREEQDRLAMQEQLIAAQQATLRELATPLIPLAEGVIVMPLVGVIDSTRSQQILETLLEGIAARQADIAILDITGVRVVDAQVANGLLRAAQAAKLLGSQVVLTGISPDIAQTLVMLGGDLSGIVTRSSLQSGIAYALERRG